MVEERQRLADELTEARQARTEDSEQRLTEVRAEGACLAGSLPVLDQALAAWQELAARRRAAVEGPAGVRGAGGRGIAERRRVLTSRHNEVERRLQGHSTERAQAAESCRTSSSSPRAMAPRAA